MRGCLGSAATRGLPPPPAADSVRSPPPWRSAPEPWWPSARRPPPRSTAAGRRGRPRPPHPPPPRPPGDRTPAAHCLRMVRGAGRRMRGSDAVRQVVQRVVRWPDMATAQGPSPTLASTPPCRGRRSRSPGLRSPCTMRQVWMWRMPRATSNATRSASTRGKPPARTLPAMPYPGQAWGGIKPIENNKKKL